GGISRKITNAADRKRLKSVAANLEVPQGMGVILRTAGASRQPEDIQRDFEYLMRLWENVRNLTLESTAPHLVYEEGSLIKRSIRDLYDKDTGEILVAGEDGYREAKDFMTMLMPNHAKNVKLYRDRVPMFARMGVEAQLDAMLQPEVTLKSGGYIIIDQTEALVAIDVNSGRSTRQHSIEETAVQTNLEAADEVARQLRLRDLAGLIVIDFIDMEEKRNIRLVEKRLKEALKDDRARIQVGRISHFGLMEMSRQRIRASVLESTTQTCPTCGGLGHVRATSSVAISVLRSIEEQLNRNSRHNLVVKVSTETALYMLNQKRDSLGDLETRFNVSISIATDDTLGNTPCVIERGEISNRRKTQETIQPDSIEVAEETSGSEIQSEIQVSEAGDAGEGQGSGKKRRRRRRRRKGGNNDDAAVAAEGDENAASGDSGNGGDSSDQEAAEASADAEAGDANQVNGLAEGGEAGEQVAEAPKGRVKRTRRKPRKDDAEASSEEAPAAEAAEASEAAEEAEEKPRRTRRKRASKKADDADAAAAADAASSDEAAAAEAAPQEAADEAPKPRRRTTRRKKSSDEDADAAADAAVGTIAAEAAEEVVAEDAPKKSGWWQRKFF
ncbi:MAG: ribonuclease E/G, partial [Hyphomicrobiales bacterium]|nr:ribonuclease E/G [Hyphomicrobiales bacterium]